MLMDRRTKLNPHFVMASDKKNVLTANSDDDNLTVDPVLDCRSLPAKSTKFKRPTRMWFSPSSPIWK